MAKFNDFQWEDDDVASESQDLHDNSDFEKLLAEERVQSVLLRVGAQVEGTILSLSAESDNVLVELSPSQTAVMDKQDLLDEEGQLTFKVGDPLVAYVISMKGSILLSRSLGKSQQAAKDLEIAQQNGVPVRGKVTKDVKGGFEVTIFGKTAFCPVSKIDLRYVENKADYVNQDFEFLIEKYEQGGRNIVVSRERLLRLKVNEKIDQMNATLEKNPDHIYTGSITDLRDYGAMVDLGGFDGFCHVSELSYARVHRPSDILARGEKVRVKVLSIDLTNPDKPRISLSMKAIDQDPWQSVLEDFKVGETYQGKVVSLSKHGAFVQLRPGLDGMIHVSEMSWVKRVHHPEELLSVGDLINVRILDIDATKRRMGLSLKDMNSDPWNDIDSEFASGSQHKGVVKNLKGFGAIIELKDGVTGLVPMKTIKAAFGETYRKHVSPPQEIDVVVLSIDKQEKKILLSLPGVKEEDDLEDFREYLAEKSVERAAKAETKVTGTFGSILAASLNKKSQD